MRRMILVAGFLALAINASAQSHPCDASVPTTATKGSKVSFCAKVVDEDLVPVDVFNFRIYIDATVKATWTNATPVSPSPSATGYIQFEMSLPGGIGRGTHPMQVSQFNGEGESTFSNTALWQIGGKPVAPTKAAVKQ